ncbi:MAG TPA: STAS domain-containing protein [Ramlibacter sp.]|jgi:anti-anti-sigma factor
MLSIDAGPEGVVLISGRLDAAQAAVAQAFLDRTSGRVVLDCSGLDYISSAGLGMLLKTQKRLVAGGGGVRLTRVTPHIRDIFQYSGLDKIFEIEAAQ